VYLTNQWYAEAAAGSRVRGSESTVYLDILTSRLHANMSYSAARMAAEAKVEAVFRATEGYAPELIREHLIIWGVRGEGDNSPLLPPEIRLFHNRYPSYLARMQREKEERERSERRRVEARESARRIEAHKKLMRDMREWGPKNGFFVGTRGRIPRKVIDAYKEAKG
jgi:hypothetical protein